MWWRIITIGIYMLLGWSLCEIEPGVEYTWYSGIWHGFFFLANLIQSWFTGTLMKAQEYTPAYDLFYWLFSVLSILGLMLGGRHAPKRRY